MVTVCVSQPGYFQRLHYFARMYESDVFVSLQGTDFTSRDMQGELDGRRLTVPVCVETGRLCLSDTRLCLTLDGTSMLLSWSGCMANTYVQRMMELVVEGVPQSERFKWSMASLGITLHEFLERVAWKGKLLKQATP